MTPLIPILTDIGNMLQHYRLSMPEDRLMA